MLEPHTRQLLLDALRPPDDYALDFAVGTTYSLDLLALLTAPLGFTRFELQNSEGADIADADAHILLRTIREFADKITVFCQAGRIAVPKGQRPLLSALEQMVVEVTPAKPGRVFHPKVWALRFSMPEAPVRYRLLILSRNLTFASSWDTLLVLDGELQERVNAIKPNHPLGAFFAHLPDRAVRGASAVVRARLEQLQDEIRKVKFECPEDFDEISFHPLGVPGVRDTTFDERVERLAVISPFLTTGRLQDLSGMGKKNVLISRLDELEKFSTQQLSGFSEIYSMSPDAVVDPERAAASAADPFGEGAGLHAKLYIGDDGWKTHIWTGSANATNAAFDGNVELLVRLRGQRKKFGVDALLATREGDTSFRDLLVPFVPSVTAVEEDPAMVALEDQLESVRTAIASATWVASVTPGDDSTFNIQLRGAGVFDPTAPGLAVNVYPITLNPTRAIALGQPPVVSFDKVSAEAITSFFAFDVVVSDGQLSQACQFVVNATLEGAPANRSEILLRAMLKDRRQLIRFLLLLLGDADDGFTNGGPPIDGSLGNGSRGAADVDALLEPLLRALDRDPSRLDHVDRLLRDLGDSKDTMPEGLSELFAPIWEARKAIPR